METAENKKNTGFAFLLSVLAAAVVLRAPITGVGTLVGDIRADLGISGSVTGFLSTIPLLAFAVVSPLAGQFSARIGPGRTLFFAALATAGAILLRSYGGAFGLIAGTILLGIAICCGNILLPVVVKAFYPQRIGLVTGAYTTSQSVCSGIAAVISVPLASHAVFGWRGALAIWAIPALAAALLWYPRRNITISPQKSGEGHTNVLRSRAAWYVTLYMGSQAILYYSSSMWFPSVLAERGLADGQISLLSSLYQWVGIPLNLIIPLLAGKMKNQRAVTGTVSALYFTGMMLMWLGKAPGALTAGVLLCGISTGCCFPLCMALIGLRTRSAADAAALSGMVQCVGYIIAAVGPVLFGALFDTSGSWALPVFCMVLGTVFNLVSGQLAGRPGYVE